MLHNGGGSGKGAEMSFEMLVCVSFGILLLQNVLLIALISRAHSVIRERLEALVLLNRYTDPVISVVEIKEKA